VPYCQEARFLGGKAATGYLWNQTGTTQEASLNISGNGYFGGGVGIGKAASAAKLEVADPTGKYGAHYGVPFIRMEGPGDVVGIELANPAQKRQWDIVSIVSSGPYLGFVPENNGNLSFRMYPDGSFKIPGSCSSDQMGTCDLAEQFLSLDGATSGDVVRLDPGRFKGLRRADTPYDPALAGVVSTTPTVVMGTSDVPEGIPVALAGVVPVKVTVEGGPIDVGDALTSSSTPGHAMRAERAGPTLGKAMEPFDGSQGRTGTIRVLISPSAGASPRDTESQSVQTLGDRVGALEAAIRDLREDNLRLAQEVTSLRSSCLPIRFEPSGRSRIRESVGRGSVKERTLPESGTPRPADDLRAKWRIP
jgi:hypothetical protein